MHETELAAGTVIAERFQLEEQIGHGAMGTVWRAQHLSLNVPVAVKAIKGALVESAEAKARFMREARAAAALRSTHVVQILDHGVHEDMPYIVMEFLEGETLSQRLQRAQTLTFDATLSVIKQVARALSLAHRRGIVHRDLKPDNIFLAKEGDHEVVKVLDFGIAKDQGASLTATLETQEGAILGTPYYLSPEQAQGSLDVDHRADLWALGVIAFECLTGRRPFESNHVGDLIVRIVSRPIPTPSSVAFVPAGFDHWFERAVARDRDARFQSSTQLSDALAGLESALDETLSDSSSDATDSSDTDGDATVTASSTPRSHGSAEQPLLDSVAAISQGVAAETGSDAVPTQPIFSRGLLLGLGLAGAAVAIYFGTRQSPISDSPVPANTDNFSAAPLAGASASDQAEAERPTKESVSQESAGEVSIPSAAPTSRTALPPAVEEDKGARVSKTTPRPKPEKSIATQAPRPKPKPSSTQKADNPPQVEQPAPKPRPDFGF